MKTYSMNITVTMQADTTAADAVHEVARVLDAAISAQRTLPLAQRDPRRIMTWGLNEAHSEGQCAIPHSGSCEFGPKAGCRR